MQSKIKQGIGGDRRRFISRERNNDFSRFASLKLRESEGGRGGQRRSEKLTPFVLQLLPFSPSAVS
jgi:hypothetical protein